MPTPNGKRIAKPMNTVGILSAIGLFISIVGLPESSYAQNSIEIDLDGQLGNGPDTVFAAVSDTIAAEIWITPTPGVYLTQFGFFACESGAILTFEEGIIEVSADTASVEPDDSCVAFFAFAPQGLFPPFLAATAKYSVMAGTTGSLSIDLEDTAWDNGDFDVRQFDSSVGAVVQVTTTATETTQWGRVKELFR